MEIYWHFVGVDKDGIPRLGYNDRRAVKVGETLTVEGEPILCQRGLHASAKLWDALNLVSGYHLALTRVTLGGTVLHNTDKSVATERTVIVMLDAEATEKLLRDWGRWCALQVIHLWDAPDIVRQYLETGDESLRDAARDAASAAASAAWDATRAATWAAWDAASAARDAAWDAASAARDAAWDAAIESYSAELERRALAAMGAAERTDAHDTACTDCDNLPCPVG